MQNTPFRLGHCLVANTQTLETAYKGCEKGRLTSSQIKFLMSSLTIFALICRRPKEFRMAWQTAVATETRFAELPPGTIPKLAALLMLFLYMRIVSEIAESTFRSIFLVCAATYPCRTFAESKQRAVSVVRSWRDVSSSEEVSLHHGNRRKCSPFETAITMSHLPSLTSRSSCSMSIIRWRS